ncbi:MAG: hypothetical protein KDA91_25210 [Planctomycetaceae bacterium]|nr:hypothetical protein [Planctomycetaceae bacterium]
MIALFVLKLTAGITLMWFLMPRKQVTDGFFRIQMRLVLGTTVLCSLLLSATTTFEAVAAGRDLLADSADQASDDQIALESPPATVAASSRTAHQIRIMQIAAAFIAYPGSIFWALGRRTPGNICIWLLTLLCTGSVVLHSVSIGTDAATWLQLLSDVSSSLVLGATLTGMLLGHWYLTTPTMSITPLWWFNRMLVVAGVLRLLASAVTFAQFGFATSDLTRQMWASIRIIGGGLVPLIVAILVWRILKHRNTQSATGVLFAGLILVFMGEMTAALLERDVHLPY